MAEKGTARKRAPARQQMREAIKETEGRVAERAVEGSAQAKQLASLQQMLTDQGRKTAVER